MSQWVATTERKSVNSSVCLSSQSLKIQRYTGRQNAQHGRSAEWCEIVLFTELIILRYNSLWNHRSDEIGCFEDTSICETKQSFPKRLIQYHMLACNEV